jgi:hypothetical protein
MRGRGREIGACIVRGADDWGFKAIKWWQRRQCVSINSARSICIVIVSLGQRNGQRQRVGGGGGGGGGGGLRGGEPIQKQTNRNPSKPLKTRIYEPHFSYYFQKQDGYELVTDERHTKALLLFLVLFFGL